MNDGEYDGGLGLARPAVGANSVGRGEAMRLLASVEYGRVVFTLNALPAVRPVNHLVDGDRIVIRTRLGAAISAAVRSAANDAVVVAYEADDFDPDRRTGWSVVVTGRAQTVTDDDDVARYEQLLHPWVNHADTVLAIEPDVITGFRIVAD
ncbi:pyridoxamine 5'-phosphate oxidase family protein [Mycolicibacterium moriokaense]|nr:pyridoxamine 5'-phosphate oxidase family protein [Mycolicibacterium moriokaense]